MRGLLGTGPPDPTLESALPSTPQGSILHRFNMDSTSKYRLSEFIAELIQKQYFSVSVSAMKSK